MGKLLYDVFYYGDGLYIRSFVWINAESNEIIKSNFKVWCT